MAEATANGTTAPPRGVGTGGRHRVVVVGAGFGGLRVARALRHQPVEVVVIDRANHHLFQPLLYQVATGILSPGQIAPPIRAVLRRQRNARVALGEAVGFDLERRRVLATTPDGRRREMAYDTLVVATGARDGWFGHPEWADHALAMKTVDQAIALRNRLLRAFETAAEVTDEEERRAWLTVVLAGGGPTGVELAGTMADLTRNTLAREFPDLDVAATRIVLLEAAPALLGPFPEPLRERARRKLVELGVDVRLSTAVTTIDENGVTVRTPEGDEERIRTRTVVWSAGVEASPLARMLGEATGAGVDRKGRVVVRPDCSLPGHPEVFAIGDMVSLGDLPGIAEPAIQQGKYVARVISRRLVGLPEPGPFRYLDLGTMATVGRWEALADLRGLRLQGPVGKVVWAVVHIAFLVGWGNRITVLSRWMWSLFVTRRGERVILGPVSGTPAADARHELPASLLRADQGS